MASPVIAPFLPIVDLHQVACAFLYIGDLALIADTPEDVEELLGGRVGHLYLVADAPEERLIS